MVPFSYFVALLVVGLLGLAVVAFLLAKIKATQVTDAKAGRIADAIRSGAMTFLREEYRIIAIVVAMIAVLMVCFVSGTAAVCFIVGSLLSMSAGYIGMRAATDANVRTT